MTSLALAFEILAQDKASKEFNNVGDAVERVGKKGAKVGALVGAGIGAAAVVVGKFAKDSINAFKEAQQSSARLDDALARFPATADKSRESFDQLNSSLAKKTRFDDDATASGQAALAQYKLTGSQIQKLTPLLQDYAAKTGQDIPAAANVLGKALLGKGKALADVGIKFKDAGSTGANFEQIVSGLRTQVGGFAEKEGKTAAGQAEILGNQFGEVQETVGSKLVPVLTKLSGKLLEVIDFTQRNSEVIGPLVGVVGGLALGIWAVNTAGKAYAATQAAINLVMSANPIGLVVAATAALGAGLIYAYKHSETFRDVVKGAFSAVSTGASFMWDKVLKPTFKFLMDAWLAVAGTIVHGAASAFGWLPKIGGSLKDAAKQFETFKDEVNRSLSGITPVKTITLRTIGQNGAGLAAVAGRHDRDIPRRALGGPVLADHPYIVGEREPELFIPQTTGRIFNQRQMAEFSSGAETATLLREQNALLREQNALAKRQLEVSKDQPSQTGRHVAGALNGVARSAATQGGARVAR